MSQISRAQAPHIDPVSDALAEVLVSLGVLRPDAAATGPELLMAAEQWRRGNERERTPDNTEVRFLRTTRDAAGNNRTLTPAQLAVWEDHGYVGHSTTSLKAMTFDEIVAAHRGQVDTDHMAGPGGATPPQPDPTEAEVAVSLVRLLEAGLLTVVETHVTTGWEPVR